MVAQSGRFAASRDSAMGKRAVAFVVIAAVAAALVVAVRSANRADAAEGNCYSEQAGPSTPTVCD